MKFTRLDHVTLFTAQPDKSIQFYKALGFTVQDAKERYMLSAGDVRIHMYQKGELLEVTPSHVQPGSVDFCIEIDGGINMFKEYLEKQGFEIAVPVTPRSGARGPMRSFFLRDPDGNLVEIASYEK